MPAFTYDPTNVATDPHRVRLEIGDTDEATALFSDSEIDAILADEVSVLSAAARCCEILAQRFARDFDFSADGASFSRSQMSEAYAKQASRLRARADGSAPVDVTRVDGYSDDIDSGEVDVDASVVPSRV